MKTEGDLLSRLKDRFSHAVIAFTDEHGYPVSVATGFDVEPERGTLLLDAVRGEEVTPPEGREVNVVLSHIRPQPGYGYDQRRYVSFWGSLRRVGERLELRPTRVQRWDEEEMSFFEFSERGVPQARRYMENLSRETGHQVKPRLAPGWLFLRATRLPFVTATVVPILLGIAVAAYHGDWHWALALLTLIAGICVHLGLNVTNDVFDTTSGADAANATPTQFSGGSRVVLYGLLSLRQMAWLAAAFYAVGLAIGLYLAVARAFWPLLAIGLIGTAISLAYTAPPLRLVHRGLGELAVFLGFGPIMGLGAYYVQAQRFSWEAIYVSVPVGILIALVLYVNEIPDRPGDAAAGKRTLPVRWSKDAVVRVYAVAAALAFGLILVGSVTGILPLPSVIALAASPLALAVYRGLREHYEDPYGLMPVMANNIKLHLFTGLLLFLGYLVATVATHLLSDPPGFLT